MASTLQSLPRQQPPQPPPQKAEPQPLLKVDRAALLFMAATNLPPFFSALATPEAVIATVDKAVLRERAQALGVVTATSTTAFFRCIAEALVLPSSPPDQGGDDGSRSRPRCAIPPEFVSASLLRSCGGGEKRILKCWRCGADVDATIDRVADLQASYASSAVQKSFACPAFDP